MVDPMQRRAEEEVEDVMIEIDVDQDQGIVVVVLGPDPDRAPVHETVVTAAAEEILPPKAAVEAPPNRETTERGGREVPRSMSLAPVPRVGPSRVRDPRVNTRSFITFPFLDITRLSFIVICHPVYVSSFFTPFHRGLIKFFLREDPAFYSLLCNRICLERL